MQTGRSDWIVAVCSVVFDLDVGQQLESVYPNAAISEATATSVAFHSFPVSRGSSRNCPVKQIKLPSLLCKRRHLASGNCVNTMTVLALPNTV